MMMTSVSIIRGSSCSTLIPGRSERPGSEHLYIKHSPLQHHETLYCPFRRLVLHCARPAPAGICWSFHGFDRATRHGAAVLVTQPAAADGLHRGDLRQRAVAVPGAAAVHQDGPAAARLVPGSVVGDG